MEFGELEEFLEMVSTVSRRSKIYIWGISVYGDLLGRLFNENGISWNGYYDNFGSVSDGKLNDKPVRKGIQADNSEEAVYVLAMRDYSGVKEQLVSLGINDKCIISFSNANVLDSIEDRLGECSVSVNEIEALHNLHNGEKCFIIGNGPSLSIDDLDAIHKHGVVSFASNFIFRCYGKTKWRPDYYFFIDVTGIREILKDRARLEEMSQNCRYVFSRSNGNLKKDNCDISNLLLYKAVLSNSEQNFDFSSDCSRQVYAGYSVTYAMMQMAAYMGFKEIYLLGMDHTFSMEKGKDGNIIKNENVENHSQLLGNYALWGIPDLLKVTNAYTAAKNYADSHGIRIYNATRGGKLEVFERVDFDSLFSNVFIGAENDDM